MTVDVVIKPFERFEQLFLIVLLYSHACVDNFDVQAGEEAAIARSNRDRAFVSKFERILDEVYYDLLQPPLISDQKGQACVLETNALSCQSLLNSILLRQEKRACGAIVSACYLMGSVHDKNYARLLRRCLVLKHLLNQIDNFLGIKHRFYLLV